MKTIITEFNDTGICRIDTEQVIKKWNRLWIISQWKENFTLIKYKQKNSPITIIKVQISKEQAMILCDKLELIRSRCAIFKNGATWEQSNSNCS